MHFKQEDKHNVFILKSPRFLPDPEVGKVYIGFDDGKLSWSRLLKWRIIEKIDLDNLPPLDDALLELIVDLEEQIADCYWLYSPDQTFIYKAQTVNEVDETYDPNIGECYFLRTKQGGWFGALSWFDSELDVDGELMKELKKYGQED